MTFRSLLARIFSALFVTFSVLSCVNGTTQSPVTPSRSAAAPEMAELLKGLPTDQGNLTEQSDLTDETPAALAAGSGGVTGEVTDPKGKVTGATVTVSCPSVKPAWKPKKTTTKNGSYTIEGVPAGNCTASFTHADYVGDSKPVTIVKGKTARVNFKFTKKKSDEKTPCDFLAWYAKCAKLYPSYSSEDLRKYNLCHNRVIPYVNSGCKGTPPS